MKLPKTILIFLFLIVAVPFCWGQNTSPKAKLFDEFGKLCSEDFTAKYDNFLIELQNDPTARGFIIFNGNNALEGLNLQFMGLLKYQGETRKFDISRITVKRGEDKSTMNTRMWLVPAGAKYPEAGEEFVGSKITSATLFDKGWADFHKPFGKLMIYADNFFYDWGCDIAPNRKEFANILLSDKKLTGYLVIYTTRGKGRSYANKVLKFAANELVNTYKVPRTRLKSIYAGNRKEPELEFWFVPAKGKLPVSDKN